MDWIQSPLAISHYSSRTSSGGEMRTNKTLFALTSMIHYQSGEDIVVILCHHPHGLCLEGDGDRGWERKVWTNGDRGEKMVISSRQGILESTARWEQTKPKSHTEWLSSAKEKHIQILMNILTNMLFILWASVCYHLPRFLRHMCSGELQNSNCTQCFSMHLNGSQWLRTCDVIPAEASLQSEELGSLCLIAQHSITATCFTQSTFKGTTFPWRLCFPLNCTICRGGKKKSQGYVNKMLCLCGGKFPFSIYRHQAKCMTLKTWVMFCIVSRRFH